MESGPWDDQIPQKAGQAAIKLSKSESCWNGIAVFNIEGVKQLKECTEETQRKCCEKMELMEKKPIENVEKESTGESE